MADYFKFLTECVLILVQYLNNDIVVPINLQITEPNIPSHAVKYKQYKTIGTVEFIALQNYNNIVLCGLQTALKF